ncbi:(Fe-S)-binding protein [Myxococcota bacterium]|nr:(Fe-S)-binding protein [Myxococcota bacterium]MBU1380537.1 (Fe-S)-binding protein [Myxococcota bacterium]MBU1497308.1 (Fe-S)-binding protein [Myxococcota bacterium]
MTLSIDLSRQLDLCSICPGMCRNTCPVHLQESRESATPSFLNRMHRKNSEGSIEREIYEKIITYCVDCGNCTEVCNHGIQTGYLMSLWRSAGKTVITRKSNSRDVLNSYYKLPSRLFSVSSINVIFPGSQTMRVNPSVVPSFFNILDLLGVSGYSLLETDNITSGYEYWISGDYDNFSKIEKINLRIFGNFKKIVFLDPTDIHVFKNLYKSKDWEKVDLIFWTDLIDTDFYANLMDNYSGPSVKWFESCILRNRLHVESIGNLTRLSQFEKIEEKLCCGGHGIFTGTEEKIIESMCIGIGEQAGSDIILTVCPSCKAELEKNQHSRVINYIDWISELSRVKP